MSCQSARKGSKHTGCGRCGRGDVQSCHRGRRNSLSRCLPGMGRRVSGRSSGKRVAGWHLPFWSVCCGGARRGCLVVGGISGKAQWRCSVGKRAVLELAGCCGLVASLQGSEGDEIRLDRIRPQLLAYVTRLSFSFPILSTRQQHVFTASGFFRYMASLPQLPNELLITIFERVRVRDGSNEDLLNVALTCNALREAAQSVLYHDICLPLRLEADSQLSRLVRSSPDPGSIQSLRLYTAKGLPAHSEALEPLYRFLASLTRLKTFSLSPKYQSNQDHVPGAVLEGLLQSLPLSVINLEFDADGYNYRDTVHTHLCLSFARLLPQLEVLRLRVSQLCTAFFSQSSPTGRYYPHLRVLVVSLNLPGLRIVTSCEHRANTLSESIVVLGLRDLYEMRAFPRLQACLVFTRNARSWIVECIHSYYIVWDVAHNTTTTIAEVHLVSSAEKGALQTGLILVHDRDGTEYFAMDDDITSFLEGDTGWEILPGGTRVPPRSTASTGYEPATWKLLNRQDADSRWGRGNFYNNLWDREAKTGCRLLKTTTHERLKNRTSPEEQLPAGWEYYRMNNIGREWSIRYNPS